MSSLDGKVVIVTGGGSGIGRATCAWLARDGAQVVVVDIDGAKANETVEELGSGLAVEADVAEEAAVAGMVAATVAEYGRIDGLDNNAANVAVVPSDRGIVDMDVGVWDTTMATNLRGPMLCCKHAIPHMIAAGGGSVVNIVSPAGQAGNLSRVAYGTSKGGLETFTRYVATMHGRDRIRCNAVAPSNVVTPALAANVSEEQQAIFARHLLAPERGRPDDVAALVAFLMRDEARYVTGQVINVDGGAMSHHPSFADGIEADVRS